MQNKENVIVNILTKQ